MFLILLDGKTRIKTDIGEEEFRYQGIRITKRKRRIITLEEGWSFKDREKTKILEEKKYTVFHEACFAPVEIYVYAGALREDWRLFQRRDFVLSSAKDSSILCLDPYLRKTYVLYENGRLKSNSKILYRNGHPCQGEEPEEGDQIELLSLTIVIGRDFLYIDCFLFEVRLPVFPVKEQTIRYLPKPPEGSFYPLQKAEEEPILPQIRPYEPYRAKEGTGFRQLIAPLVLSLCMAASAVMNGFDERKALAVFLMPGAFFFSGFLLPFFFLIAEKRRERKREEKTKRDYLSYLEEEKKAIEEFREETLRMNQEKAFLLDRFEERRFQRRGEPYLTLGARFYDPGLVLPECGDEEISKALRGLRESSLIPAFPFFLPLKKGQRTVLIIKEEDRAAYFRLFLLELLSSYPPGHLYTGVYAEREVPFLIPALPKGRRLFCRELRDLQEADAGTYDRPVVFFLLKETSYRFQNDQITTIAFFPPAIPQKEDVIVEINGNRGRCGPVSFSILPEKRDLDPYFEKLGSGTLYLKDKEEKGFRDLFPDLDLKRNYSRKHRDLTARFAYLHDEVFAFDLHEKGYGPHGLIAGTTGSGKSELIVSMLLSLCLAYPPDYLRLILVDYKGGGITSSLSYKGQMVPHISAAVSDLDEGTLERLIAALRHECRKREKAFHEAGKAEGRAIASIDDYREIDGVPSMAHLLIVIDEFAEMKKEHPELISELISLSRIGRSLGLHLILATQRPAGVIDEEIRSNSRFRIALRMSDEGDSREILGRIEAAHLQSPGEFCFLADRSFLLAKSVYAKSDPLHEPYRFSVLRYDLKKEREKTVPVTGAVPEIVTYVKMIERVSREMGLSGQHIDLLPPKPGVLEDLYEKGRLVLGQKDDFLRQDDGLLSYSEREDLLIISARKKELDTLLFQYEKNGIPVLLIARKRHYGPMIRESLLYDEEEDIAFLFHQLKDARETGMAFLIEDLSLFCALKEEYPEELQKLIRLKGRNGLSFCFLSSSLKIPYRLMDSFEHRALIGSSREEDVRELFGKKALMSGSSFYELDGVRPFVPALIPEYPESGETPSYLRRIPSSFSLTWDEENVLIGYDYREREKIFVKKEELLVCSFTEELLRIYEKA
ncbi:MAG: hypothetical protein IIZ47_01420, partial [Erysipelotrichaceae bacterium]|nr:hypothetical protein [Erysipelotrichaceae bacterium]